MKSIGSRSLDGYALGWMGKKVNIMPGGRVNDGLGDVFVMLSCVFLKARGSLFC